MNETTLLYRIAKGYYSPATTTQIRTQLQYNVELERLEQTVFKIDALVTLGIFDHPKADRAWKMAWDRGHSSGLEEIYQELKELCELLTW